MAMDQYEIAVAEAIARALCCPDNLIWPNGIEAGRTVLREGDYDIDTAHGEMLPPEAAAVDALDEFGAAKCAQRGG